MCVCVCVCERERERERVCVAWEAKQRFGRKNATNFDCSKSWSIFKSTCLQLFLLTGNGELRYISLEIFYKWFTSQRKSNISVKIFIYL